MANVEQLQKTLEHIKEHPGSWSQLLWSHCFAGLTLKLNGEEPVGMPGDVIRDRASELLGLELVSRPCACGCGQEAAGGHELFAADNTLNDLERIVQELTAAEPVTA